MIGEYGGFRTMQHLLLRSVILDQQEIVRNFVIIPRKYAFDANGNYILTGLRRSGKSTVVYGVIQALVSQGVRWEQIVYINFEDERLAEFKVSDFNDIVGVAKEMCDDKTYYYFDEIQNIEGWQMFARRMADSKQYVYITGSNATMLSREMEAALGGRYLVRQIYPYNFGEYLVANGVVYSGKELFSTEVAGRIRGKYNDYLHFGGFPESVHYAEKREYVRNVYQKILLGDMALRNGIRNLKPLTLLMKKLAESVKDSISATKLQGILSSIGCNIAKDTIIDYLSYAEESYLIFPVRNYFSRFAEKEGKHKYYFSDNGILNLFLLDKESLLLENMVAIALNQRFGDEVWYLRSDRTGVDVDFYIPSEGTAIQVIYDLTAESREREIRSLRRLASSMPEVKRFVVITEDAEDTVALDSQTVEVIPLWKWLLG